jgi:hypothetical protein
MICRFRTRRITQSVILASGDVESGPEMKASTREHYQGRFEFTGIVKGAKEKQLVVATRRVLRDIVFTLV